MTPNIELLHIDCMEYMAGLPDKAFELAIVDPPYGIKENGERSNRPRKTDKWQTPKPKGYTLKNWDIKPKSSYFNELKRVSKNQIVWGANHFFDVLNINTISWIFWDKNNGDNDFADGELAWTSFNKAVRKFNWLWNGFQKQQPEERFHPTQKPIALYRWLLHNYAKPGDKILDTHGGSRSLAIACHQMGFDHVSCEIDLDYHNDSVKRFKEQTMQQDLFKQAV